MSRAKMTSPVRVRPTVSIRMRDPVLGELLRTDLGRNGFDVVADRSADVVVTGRRGELGRRVTVHVGADIEVQSPNGTWWFPSSELDRLPDLLRMELERTGDAA